MIWLERTVWKHYSRRRALIAQDVDLHLQCRQNMFVTIQKGASDGRFVTHMNQASKETFISVSEGSPRQSHVCPGLRSWGGFVVTLRICLLRRLPSQGRRRTLHPSQGIAAAR